MTLQFKLIIAAILAGLVAYSYVWTYNAGGRAARGACVSEQVQALKSALEEQEQQFRDQREAEMRAAAETAAVLRKNNEKLKVNLAKANEILKRKENEVIANTLVPDELVVLLNSTRGSTSPST
jgi:Tfp pilus assembly protein PilE